MVIKVGASRALGGLLLAVCVVVAVLHIWFGYVDGEWGPNALVFALPVTVGLLVVCGLGSWLGWIMVTTKPAAAVTPPSPELEEAPKPSEVPTEEIKVEKAEKAPEEKPEEAAEPEEEPKPEAPKEPSKKRSGKKSG